MVVCICPGIHPVTLTQSFLSGLAEQWQIDALQVPASSNFPDETFQEAGFRLTQPADFLLDCIILPTESYPAYSPGHVIDFLQQQLKHPFQSFPFPHAGVPLVFISYSAGVVGAIAAALIWHNWGGTVKAFIALDGWGVPLYAPFPIHRVSHDYFTEWSSACLGAGEVGFYADPAVEHLEVWRAPHQVTGQWVRSKATDNMVNLSLAWTDKDQVRGTLAQFLLSLLLYYGELAN
jgi:hypothetical protein